VKKGVTEGAFSSRPNIPATLEALLANRQPVPVVSQDLFLSDLRIGNLVLGTFPEDDRHGRHPEIASGGSSRVQSVLSPKAP
jgi:hypothetical protein